MKHEANDLFHEALDSMVHRYELLSFNIALSFRRINTFTFPDYYEVASSNGKEENELQVYGKPDEDNRPLCVINEGILFEGLEQENEWMKINHSNYKGVWVRTRSNRSSSKRRGPGHLLIKRMEIILDKPDSESKTSFWKKFYSALRYRAKMSHVEPLTISHCYAIYHPRYYTPQIAYVYLLLSFPMWFGVCA